jgi:hypothetical protein
VSVLDGEGWWCLVCCVLLGCVWVSDIAVDKCMGAVNLLGKDAEICG